MKKLTVSDAAKELGITKEAIYNRIRRGTIESVMEGDERYIIIANSNKSSEGKLTPTSKSKNIIPDERYINLLISQIDELKATNTELNKDKERLIKEKEQLLIEQRVALETIYKERDEQLKAILTLANRSLLAKPVSDVEKVTIDANFEEKMEKWRAKKEDGNDAGEEDEQFSDWRELKSYLKAKGFSKKEKKKIISHVKEAAGQDIDVQEDEGVLYVKKEEIEKFI
ncbi:MAG: helix-turn-helix domain-containing protein [Campylobacteraceae bacterium]|nr:helix-turn-helix domain-containing protein [Campylobacteraceae bacterium]